MIEKIFPSVAWDTVYFGNALGMYVDALIVFIILLIIFYLIRKVILNRLHKLSKTTQTDIDDTFIDIIESIRPPFFYFLALYIAGHRLVLGEFFEKALYAILVIMFVYQIIASVQILINFIAKRSLGNEGGDEHLASAVRALSIIAKVILWIFGVLLIMSNLGINITSLVAGLGISGIAIAIALQGVLEDLFASFSIYFDKPFTVGDFVETGEHSGTIEKIGIKTTRMRSLDGEEIVISNKELTESRIHNYRRMDERRIAFGVGVTYETPTSMLKEIPQIFKEIVDGVEGVRFDRAHFKEFEDSSLDFEIVYYVESKEYVDYMNYQQKINYAIREKFEAKNIEMAYPTRTLYTKSI